MNRNISQARSKNTSIKDLSKSIASRVFPLSVQKPIGIHHICKNKLSFHTKSGSTKSISPPTTPNFNYPHHHANYPNHANNAKRVNMNNQIFHNGNYLTTEAAAFAASSNDSQTATIVGAIMACSLSYSLVEYYKRDDLLQNIASKGDMKVKEEEDLEGRDEEREGKGTTRSISISSSNSDYQYMALLYSLHYFHSTTSKYPINIDLSHLASYVDWKRLIELSGDNKFVKSAIYYLWSSLIQGIDLGCSILPIVDVRPQSYLSLKFLLDSMHIQLSSNWKDEKDEVNLNKGIPISSFQIDTKKGYLELVQQLTSNHRIASLMIHRIDPADPNPNVNNNREQLSGDIIDSLINTINEGVLISPMSNRFVRFSSNSSGNEIKSNDRTEKYNYNSKNYSSEMILLALSSLSNILSSSLSDNSSPMKRKIGTIKVNTNTDKKISTILEKNDQNKVAILKLSSLLQALEEQESEQHIKIYNTNLSTGKVSQDENTIFQDRQLLWYQYFFPNSVRDQSLRRGREVETYICDFFYQLSKQRDKSLLYTPEVVNALLPLVNNEKGEGRNISAYHNASKVLKSIYIDHLNRKFKAERSIHYHDHRTHSPRSAADKQETSSSSSNGNNEIDTVLQTEKDREEEEGEIQEINLIKTMDNLFLKYKYSVVVEENNPPPIRRSITSSNQEMIRDKTLVAAENDFDIDYTPYLYPNSNENVITSTLTSTSLVRCFTSSMISLVVGGVYSLLRAKPSPRMDPLMIYSKAGVGAMLLNVLYGTYGMRNWLQKHIYVEDKHYNALVHTGLGVMDISCITAIVRQHPYAFLPFLMVNILGHNTTVGNGLKRLDGLDCFFSLD